VASDVRVRIIDYGPGISSEIIDSVFDPYYSTKYGINRGLGLWVVRTFVEAFHGRVSVVSPIERLSRGSIFEIVFPSAHRDDVDPSRFFGTLKVSEVL
jgi:two-component system NtrC family sensor kinase